MSAARDAHARWVNGEVGQFYLGKRDHGTAAGQRLRRELANIREALAWLVESRQWEQAAQLGVMLGLVLSDEPQLDLCSQLRQLQPPTPTASDVDSLRAVAAAVGAWVQGDTATADRLLTAAVDQLPGHHPQRWIGHFIRVMNGVLVGTRPPSRPTPVPCWTTRGSQPGYAPARSAPPC